MWKRMAAAAGLAMILGACAVNGGRPVLGPVMDEPIGWSDYCQRVPTDPSC